MLSRLRQEVTTALRFAGSRAAILFLPCGVKNKRSKPAAMGVGSGKRILHRRRGRTPSTPEPAATMESDLKNKPTGHLAQSTRPENKFREWLNCTAKHGALMTGDIAAAALGVSRQRVHQLICKGQLESVSVGDHRYVPLAKLKAFCASRRRTAYQCREF